MTAALADLTPVAVQFIPEPLITWMDLRGLPFTEPFFRDTVAKGADRPLALSGIDELRALDDRPTLPPALFIFHVSRCGSTLLSQMLAALPSNTVVSEPASLNAVLSARRPAAEAAELLRLVIRALGRNRGDEARRLIVKFSSWNVLAATTIHRLFPDTPMLWLQRAPDQVLASHAEQPAGWTAWRENGDPALGMFELSAEQAQALTPLRFRSHAIETLYRAAHQALHQSGLPFQVIDYRELPGALWEKIGRHANLSWTEHELARMRARARLDAKAGSAKAGNAKAGNDRPFVPTDRVAALAADEQQYVAERIAPLYRALARQET